MTNTDHHFSADASSIPKILIIEDETVLAHLLSDLFKLEGFEAHSVSDGAKAVDAVKKIMPHIITLDIMLPNLNGFEVCKLIKSDDHIKHIPILMLTSLAHAKDKEMGIKMGASCYMTKPFDSMELLRNVKQLVEKKTAAT